MAASVAKARIFGFIGNRADLGARVVAHHAPALRVRDKQGEPVGWGVGFYQSGEVLLRRKPLDEREAIDLGEVARGVRTDLLLAHVRNPTIGNLRTENTHPFRYRHWLFASSGTLAGFEHLRDRLLESIPEFLLRNVRGDTDSELFFYLFLSFLHDAGHLDGGSVRAEHIRTAMRSATSLADRLSAEEGHPPNTGDVFVTDGEHLVIMHREGGMALCVLEDSAAVEALHGESSESLDRISSVDNVRFTLVASDLDTLPSGWRALDERSLLTLDHTGEPALEPLDARPMA